MQIKFCRNCKNNQFSNLFSLGKMSFTGRFPKSFCHNVPKAYLNLLMCKKCKLVQLDRNFNLRYLYGKGYGYRTGINKTMTEHIKNTVKKCSALVNLKMKDHVLDIASNDATLLNFYPKNVITVGVDPLVNKYKKHYNKINYKISNFFKIKDIEKIKIKKKFKIISALSVFYDLRDPNKFIKEIKKILDDKGVFVLEHVDLYYIIKNNIFDTICHEHLGYFSSKVIINMIKKNGLKVFNHEFNDINGGSSRYYIAHKNSKYKVQDSIKKVLNKEDKIGLHSKKTFDNFFKRIIRENKKLINLIAKIKSNNLSIHGYGASTKGNVLLQYCNIDSKLINCIAEVNKFKFNKFTPGTNIKIVSEKEAKLKKPDYLLVLPWHFKDHIIKREQKFLKDGGKLIFPLPDIEII